MQSNFFYAEIFGKPPSLEENFNFPVEHNGEFIVSGERTLLVVFDKFCIVGKNTWNVCFFCPLINQFYAVTQVPVP